KALKSPQELQNVTCKELSNSSFVVNFNFSMENVSVSQNGTLLNATYKRIQDAVNVLVRPSAVTRGTRATPTFALRPDAVPNLPAAAVLSLLGVLMQ
ncbi:hypothetical protein GN956_G27196, partial [Arapaima gigas]